jgi:F-type H+-transporting ATPase subunit delta
MQEGTIGRRYARALNLSLTDEGQSTSDARLKQLARVEEQLLAVAGLLERRGGDAAFRQAMLNPSFAADQRKSVITEVGKAHDFDPVTISFLTLLVDKDRLSQLPAIARAFRNEVDERLGRVRATIATAKALDARELTAIVAGLEKTTGKKVVPDVEVDPSLIAGVQARIGGLVYDATVRAQLSRLRQEFQVN